MGSEILAFHEVGSGTLKSEGGGERNDGDWSHGAYYDRAGGTAALRLEKAARAGARSRPDIPRIQSGNEASDRGDGQRRKERFLTRESIEYCVTIMGKEL